MRLALGTVQFGLPYGVANKEGQVSTENVKDILDAALSAGVDTLDTAIAYGESERILGLSGGNRFQLITKLPEVPPGVNVSHWVSDQVALSCERLGVSSLYGLMLHRPEQLSGTEGEALYQALRECRSSGWTKKLGVSVYQSTELDAIYHTMHFDLVQLPLNILDRRMQSSGWLKRLKDKGVEIHARSLFLQGLLLMEAQERPDKFSKWSDLWQQWHDWIEQNSISALEACITYGMQIPELDRLVVGVDSLQHFHQVLAAVEAKPLINCFDAPFSNDPYLINPANWNQL